MPSFKGILKYLALIFVVGWMFFLGILVGRGTSPVNFDTENFQKRLAAIANNIDRNRGPEEKVELEFYEVLDKPASEESVNKSIKPREIVPAKDTQKDSDEIPVKKSLKSKTIKKGAGKAIVNAKPEEKVPAVSKSKSPAVRKPDAAEKTASKPVVKTKTKEKEELSKSSSPSPKDGKTATYTIQIASFRDFRDALKHMEILEKKGYTSYRAVGKKDDKTWYRVRIGSFQTRSDAKKFLAKLKSSKIDGLIIKISPK